MLASHDAYMRFVESNLLYVHLYLKSNQNITHTLSDLNSFIFIDFK